MKVLHPLFPELYAVPLKNAWLARCLDCGQGDCPRWLAEHKRDTGHKHVYYFGRRRTQSVPVSAAVASTPVEAGAAVMVLAFNSEARLKHAQSLCRRYGHAVPGPNASAIWANWQTCPCACCGEIITREVA